MAADLPTAEQLNGITTVAGARAWAGLDAWTGVPSLMILGNCLGRPRPLLHDQHLQATLAYTVFGGTMVAAYKKPGVVHHVWGAYRLAHAQRQDLEGVTAECLFLEKDPKDQKFLNRQELWAVLQLQPIFRTRGDWAYIDTWPIALRYPKAARTGKLNLLSPPSSI